jgi:hypothetical protein
VSASMTLDQFIAFVPILLGAFAESTREHGKTDDTFNQERDLFDWCNELSAYVGYTELQEDALRERGGAK